MEDPRRRDIALFRYGLIREAADPELTPARAGPAGPSSAAKEHRGPDGEWKMVGRSTLDRWIVAYRAGGFDALVPAERRREPVSDVELLDLAVKLKRENPARTATHIVELIVTELAGQDRQVPSDRTVQRHFARLGLNVRPDGTAPEAFGRFEAANVNDLWVGDVAHGPKVGGRKALLFAFMDDHSRLIVGHRWGRHEDVLRLEAALRRGIASRGVPGRIYVDNGSPFISHQLQRICAVLGIRLVHSKARGPRDVGRSNGSSRPSEASSWSRSPTTSSPPGGAQPAVHRLGRDPLPPPGPPRNPPVTDRERFTAAGIPDVPTPAELREAFLWAEMRTVTKTAMVSLHGNHYEVDPVLVGRRVQLVFDPFDLTTSRSDDGHDFGTAIPHELKVHVHPKATAEPPECSTA
jgi:putative transposase